MGCDIHLYTERKIKVRLPDEQEKTVWMNSDNWFIDEWSYSYSDHPRMCVKDVYYGRNYDLFTVLAGVRNYRDWDWFVEPKGIPDDISEDVKNIIDRYGGDGHTHSYLTLREILDIDWERRVEMHDYVTKDVADHWNTHHEMPDEWMTAMWAHPLTGMVELYYDEPLKNSCQDFLDSVVPYLKNIIDEKYVRHEWVYEKDENGNKIKPFRKPSKGYEPENFYDDVRIVFFFDN
ncbi:MAG: hypothetical protein WC175_04190 [Candidatus Dojkabacteria bacterium]